MRIFLEGTLTTPQTVIVSKTRTNIIDNLPGGGCSSPASGQPKPSMAHTVIALHTDHKKQEPVVEKSLCTRQIETAAKQGVHSCKSDIPESRQAERLLKKR